MPEWITHLGTAYCGARAAKIPEIQTVLVGAILPDLAVPIFVVADLGRLSLTPEAFAYLLGFQSLTVTALVAGALAQFLAPRSRSFLLLLGVATTHYFLDILETDIDCGMRVFYPFFYGWWSPATFAPGTFASSALFLFSATALATAVYQRHRLGCVRLEAGRANLVFAAGLLGLALLLPATTREAMVRHNVHSLAFLANPTIWQNASVDLCFSQVVSESPAIIEELGRSFELIGVNTLQIGEKVSVRGVYSDGKIQPTHVYHHAGFAEAWSSLIGLGCLALLFDAGRLTVSDSRWEESE